MDNHCVICWKGRCSYAKCKYCQCCICKQCMTKMLKLYKQGNDFLRLCPNCRSNLNWARKKNGTIIAFPDFDYDDIIIPGNPFRPILNIYHILLSFTGITLMVFILCKLLTTMQNPDKGILFLVSSITLLPFLVR